jgi:transposase-like protein
VADRLRRCESIDESYFGVNWPLFYLYRMIDSTGSTIDFLLSDAEASKHLFGKSAGSHIAAGDRVLSAPISPSHPMVTHLSGWSTKKVATATGSQYLNNTGTKPTSNPTAHQPPLHLLRKGQVCW